MENSEQNKSFKNQKIWRFINEKEHKCGWNKKNLNTSVFVVADLLTDYLYMEMYHLVIAFAHVNIHCKILD